MYTFLNMSLFISSKSITSDVFLRLIICAAGLFLCFVFFRLNVDSGSFRERRLLEAVGIVPTRQIYYLCSGVIGAFIYKFQPWKSLKFSLKICCFFFRCDLIRLLLTWSWTFSGSVLDIFQVREHTEVRRSQIKRIADSRTNHIKKAMGKL